MKAVLVAINAKYSHTNLAIRYLRQILQATYDCDMAEYTINQPVKAIVADLECRKPDIILFSCYIWNIDMAIRVASDMRTLFPKARIILGGPEITNESNFDFADAIICGEGENIIAEAICGEGRIYKSDKYIDLDLLQFPYEDLDELQNRVLYYESTRGCPFGCSYCLSSADRKLRTRSLPLVFEDLQGFLNAKVMRVKFVDRTFNILPERAIAIWEYLMNHDNGVTGFQMELGGDLLTPDQLIFLSKARPGLFQFEIGVQSTDTKTLETVCRKTNMMMLCDNIRAIKKMGNIHCHLDLIAGLPGEHFERFLQSYDEVFALQPEQLQLGFLKLLRGSRLWYEREYYGLHFSQYAPYEVLETPEISFAELARLKQLEEMTEIYYNSGRFSLTISHLLRDISPSKFFLGLADTISGTPGKYEYYELLFNFAQKQSISEIEKLRWLIRADLCMNEKPRRIPSCCPEGLRPNRSKLGNIIGYAEIFPFDFTNPNAPKMPVMVIFDYEHRTLSGHASLQIIRDFLL